MTAKGREEEGGGRHCGDLDAHNNGAFSNISLRNRSANILYHFELFDQPCDP